jgi:hypothetical protein
MHHVVCCCRYVDFNNAVSANGAGEAIEEAFNLTVSRHCSHHYQRTFFSSLSMDFVLIVTISHCLTITKGKGSHAALASLYA